MNSSAVTIPSPSSSMCWKLRGFVDGTLVFGTALVSLLAQAHLVKGVDFGLAYSAVGFGLFYVLLATTLWRVSPETTRRLSEAFVALAVGFGTMAIPFFFEDSPTTSIAWSLEGAGIYWFAVRQQRRFAQFAGIFLQLLAALALFIVIEMRGLGWVEGSSPLANSHFLSCCVLAVSAFFISYLAERREQKQTARSLVIGMGVWGFAWWSYATIVEVNEFVPANYQVLAFLMVGISSALLLEWVSARATWNFGSRLSLLLLPAGYVILLDALFSVSHLLADGGLVAWPLLFFALYWVLGRPVQRESGWIPFLYAPALWLVALVSAFSFYGVVDSLFELRGDWRIAAFGLGIAVVLGATLRLVNTEVQPFLRYAEFHRQTALMPVVLAGLLWIVFASGLARGDTAPLIYLPLLNPVDIVAALVGLLVFFWWLQLRESQFLLLQGLRARNAAAIMGVITFLWLNGMLARSVYQWTSVSFNFDSLWASIPLQVAFSITWTLVGLVGMLYSTRHGLRLAWIVFAALLACVVVKLFLVDLSQLSTGAKIATFLIVGVLLLVVGYFSPVPPGESEELPAGDA